MASDTLRREIHRAFRAWHQPDYDPGAPLLALHLVQQELADLATRAELDAGARHLAVNRVLESALDILAMQEPQDADILRRRFLDQQTSRRVGLDLKMSEDAVNHQQARAIRRLAGLLERQERARRAARLQELEGRLPPRTYTELFGVAQTADALEADLLRDGQPWVVSLTGIGGIGKTAVADWVARRVAGQFHYQDLLFARVDSFGMSGRSLAPERVWEQVVLRLAELLELGSAGLSAAGLAPEIRRRLKLRPTLVIIDNLEEAADAALVLANVREWTDPSRVLITSRARPIDDLATATHTLNELPEADALALVRHEAGLRGLDAVARAPDAELKALCQAIGGNPLALKLAVSLAQFMSLGGIVADLQQGQTRTTRAMYLHIYRAAWQALSPEGRELLEAMPLVGDDGATVEQLAAVTELDEASLAQAIHELGTRSLLEVRGTPWERRYGIHRLTETFLHAEITRWMNGSERPVD